MEIEDMFEFIPTGILLSGIMFGCYIGGYKVFLLYSGAVYILYLSGFYAKLYNHYFKEIELEDKEEEKDEVVKEVVKYEEKYLDRFDRLENVPLSLERLEGLKNVIVMETTPLGNVILFWDQSKEAFTYYSDASIPYRYLEVVARKYVILNNCKGVYVDMREELKEAERRKEEKLLGIEEKKKGMVEEKKSVFAQLKQYNQPGSIVNTKTGANKATAASKVNANTGKDKMNDAFLVKERANIYSRDGKVNQFSFLKKVKREVLDKRMTLSFSDFKREVLSGV